MIVFDRQVKLKRKGVNLTSLIDVIFLLVVFFMLTSKYNVYEEFPLQLSVLKEKNTEHDKLDLNTIEVTLAANHSFIADDIYHQLIQLADYIETLIEFKALDAANVHIVLRNNEGVTTQEILYAMQQVKTLGVGSVSMVEGEDD